MKAILLKGVKLTKDELTRIDEDYDEYLYNQGWLVHNSMDSWSDDVFLGQEVGYAEEGGYKEISIVDDLILDVELQGVFNTLKITRKPSLFLIQRAEKLF